MKELKLTSPIPPSVNHYLAYRTIRRKNGKPLAMSYKTAEAKEYQSAFIQYVEEECDKQGWTDAPDPLQHFYVDTVFYFPQTDLDANNYFKVMLDAITETGRVWADDNVVCERVQAIYYNNADPKIEIVIHPVDYIGIFPDRVHLEEFESRCVDCRRYKRNCSILRRAKEGRVQGETDGVSCLAYTQVKTKGSYQNSETQSLHGKINEEKENKYGKRKEDHD